MGYTVYSKDGKPRTFDYAIDAREAIQSGLYAVAPPPPPEPEKKQESTTKPEPAKGEGGDVVFKFPSVSSVKNSDKVHLIEFLKTKKIDVAHDASKEDVVEAVLRILNFK